MKKLAIILVALSLLVGLGYGQSQAQAPVNQMAIDPGTIGDLLLFAPYDVRDVDGRTAAWQNFLVIENTSDKWTAFHLRFRAWKKSIEVYDHVILLSPFDVFWGVIQLATEDGTTREGNNQGIYPMGSNFIYKAGSVLFWTQDYETAYWSGLTYEDANAADTIIEPPAGWYWRTRFQPDLLDDCGFVADLNNLTPYEQYETQAGEIEAIGLWSLSNPLSPAADTSNLHNVVSNVYPETNTEGDPAINVFDVMNALYYEYSSLNPIARADGLQANPNRVVLINNTERAGSYNRLGLDCGNVLAGAFSMGDTTTGRFALANMVAISNFRTDNTFYTTGHYPTATPAAGQTAPWHRDGVAGGYIVFPIEALFWSWDATLDQARIPYYVNENWATTVGPGLRDGDDWNGELQVAGGCLPGYTIQPFNNMWSLDELEDVLANNEIWYHYFNNAFNSSFTTDVVIAFFTKHYHYFFADWPFWTVAAAPYTGGPPDAIMTQAQYWRAVYDYRGNRGATKIGGAIEYRDVEDECNPYDTIAEWFEYKYANGKVQAYAYVWDMEENKPSTTPDFQPPPGSPWHPAPPPSGRYIHHQVNIIRVMAPQPTETGHITDANGFLTNPAGYQYDKGHFALTGVALVNGQRASGTPVFQPESHYGLLDTDHQQAYFLPSIGVVIFDLNYVNQGVTSIDLYRMTMAPWHYRLAKTVNNGLL